MGFDQYHEPSEEFLLRKKPEWRDTLKRILFSPGDIVKRGAEGEEAADD